MHNDTHITRKIMAKRKKTKKNLEEHTKQGNYNVKKNYYEHSQRNTEEERNGTKKIHFFKGLGNS